MSAPQKPPMVAAQHITRAKQELAAGDHTAAQTHALIAIAELMATNMTDVMTDVILDATTRGAVAATEALGTILSVTNPTRTLCGARGDSGAACERAPGHTGRHENGQTWWTH